MIRTGLPFSTTTLLGLDQPNTDALVLDGQVIRLSDRRSRDGGAQVLVNRLPRAVTGSISLTELLSQAMRGHRTEIEHWVQRTHGRPGLLAPDLPALSLAASAGIERFVRKILVPRLEREQGVAPVPVLDPAPSESLEDPVELAVLTFTTGQLWPRWFAIWRDTWYGLAPFAGERPSGRFHLVWKGRAFIAMSSTKGRLAIRSYDERLESLIGSSFRDLPQQRPESTVVYQSPPYTVFRTQRQHFFLCRQLPPYVIEGQSRALYLFPGVQIGIPITALEADTVLWPLAARVMHAYRHMFAQSFGGWTPICMPQPTGYYTRLHQLPLEEALLQHLESARMTLCAGYHQGNRAAIFHDIARLHMPRISLAETQARNLPVYRYYRK